MTHFVLWAQRGCTSGGALQMGRNGWWEGATHPPLTKPASHRCSGWRKELCRGNLFKVAKCRRNSDGTCVDSCLEASRKCTARKKYKKIEQNRSLLRDISSLVMWGTRSDGFLTYFEFRPEVEREPKTHVVCVCVCAAASCSVLAAGHTGHHKVPTEVRRNRAEPAKLDFSPGSVHLNWLLFYLIFFTFFFLWECTCYKGLMKHMVQKQNKATLRNRKLTANEWTALMDKSW